MYRLGLRVWGIHEYYKLSSCNQHRYHTDPFCLSNASAPLFGFAQGHKIPRRMQRTRGDEAHEDRHHTSFHPRPDQRPRAGAPGAERADAGHARPGFRRAHAAAVPRPEEGAEDEGPAGPHVSRLRHRRLGGGDLQHALARRQGAGCRARAVLPPLDRHGRAARARRPGQLDAAWGAGVPVERFSARARRRQGRTRSRRSSSPTTRPRPASPPTSPACARRWTRPSTRALLFVDGVSSIGSIDFRMDEWGVDVAVTGIAERAHAAGRPRHRRRQREGAGSDRRRRR